MNNLPKVKRLTFSEIWQLHQEYTHNNILKSLKIIYPKKHYESLIDANTFADLIIGLHSVGYETFVEQLKKFN